MIEENRITFLGDKVAHGRWSKLGAFLMGNDVAAVGIAVAFAAVATEIAAPGAGLAVKSVVATLKANILNIAAARAIETYLLWNNCVEEPLSAKKVINKKPDPNQPSNLDRYGTVAHGLRNAYAFLSVFGLAAVAYEIGSLNPINGFSLILEACSTASMATRLVSGFRRWNNVWNGKWRVEDRGPPPEPVRKPVQDLNPVVASAAARVAHAPT